MRLRIAIAIGLAAYFGFLLRYNSFFAAGPDSAGYCNEAKLIASGRMRLPIPMMRELGLDKSFADLFSHTGLIPGRRPFTLMPSYPAGLPLHQALFARIGGWTYAPFLVAPLAAIGSFLLIVGIARELRIEPLFAVGAGAIELAIPVLIAHAIQPVSDVPAAFYALLTIWLALRAEARPVLAIAAGAAMGMGAWVRPTNLLIAVPLAVALRPRAWKLAAAGALPFAIVQALWNKQLYGHPFRTGYGSLFDVLSWRPLCGTFHLITLAEMLTPLVVIGGVLAFFDRGIERRHRAMLASWIAAFYLFYAFYGYCQYYVSSRFLLPAMPALLLAFALALQRSVTSRVAAVAVVVAIVIADIIQVDARGALVNQVSESVYPETIRWAEARLPKNAIVASDLMSGAFVFYSGRIPVHWAGTVDRERLAVLRAAAKKAHLQWFAVLSDGESGPDPFNAWLPATWTPVATNRDVTLWRLME